MVSSHLIVAVILVASGLAVAAYDLRRRTIPNWLTLAIALCGLSLHIGEAGLKGSLGSLAGATAGAALLLLPYMMGGMGAGDLKLMASLGALVDVKGVLILFIFSAVFGGVLSIAALLLDGKLADGTGRVLAPLFGVPKSQLAQSASSSRRVMVPYGVAISCGALVTAGLLV